MVIKVKYNGEWVKIPYLSDVHGEELVTEAPKDDKQYARQNGVWTVVNIPEVDFTDIYTALDAKVDKVEGKGLSTEDYLTLDKTKVNNLNEVLENAVLNTTATGSTITLDKRNLVTGVLDNVELNIPVSTTDLAGLMLPADKIKLNGIAANAEVNVNADWNATEGGAQILNKPTLATVATSGSYNDLSDKPNVVIKNEDEDAAMAVLVELVKNVEAENYTCTQDQYDTLKALFKDATENTCRVIKPSTDFVILHLGAVVSNVVIIYDYEDSKAFQIMFDANMEMLLSGTFAFDLNVSLDLSLIRVSVNTNTFSSDGNNIVISQQFTNSSGGDNINAGIILQTKGDKSESLMADGNYRKLPVYGRNLLLGSGKEVSNSNYPTASYWLTESIQKNAEVTCTIWGDLGEGLDHFMLFNAGDRGDQLVRYTPEDFVNGKASKTFKWRTQTTDGDETSNTFLRVYAFPKSSTTSTIHKIKLEYGDISTEWTPAWEEIPDLEERYAYGVEWDTASSSPDGVRVGNMQLHRELPIQSKMRRCILDNNGGVVRYIYDSNEYQSSILNEAIMTEIPQHWYKLYTEGTKFKMMLSAMPLPGYKEVSKFYISTCEAIIERNSGTLGSANMLNNNNVQFRGGDNTADWDETYRSLLGRPVTNFTRDQFRQAARKRGSGWEMYTYGAHKTLFWLFAVEYATLNSQKPFNAQKDANGFSQGGLGEGASQMTDWINFNNANPLIPCGYTNEFGNGSGEKAHVVKNASDGTHATLMANRYRGIENPFGHIWKHTDGANIQVTTGDAGLSILWTTDDPSNFSDTSYTGYDKKGNICRTNGYAKKMLLGENGDIIPTEVDGSSSTYWCDYYRTTITIDGIFVVLAGSSANGALGNGLASIYGGYTSNSARDIGTRLCFFPKYKSTEITTTTE